jgi:hypothetical protein
MSWLARIDFVSTTGNLFAHGELKTVGCPHEELTLSGDNLAQAIKIPFITCQGNIFELVE